MNIQVILTQTPKSYHTLRYIGPGSPNLGENIKKTPWLVLRSKYDFDQNVTTGTDTLSTGRLEAPFVTVLGKYRKYLA